MDAATDRKAIDGSDPEQIARIRSDQNELINAFRAKHGLEPDDVCVDVRRLPNNRLVWDVRKMSVAEREARGQMQIKAQLDAIRASEKRSYVYFNAAGERWWEKLFGKWWPTAVHLTEKGAMQASPKGGMLGKIEVKA